MGRGPSAADVSRQARPLARPPVGLYIHIPFCVSLCPYCDFVVVAGAAARGPANRIEALAAALQTELELRADALDQAFGAPGTATRPALDTVYLDLRDADGLARQAVAAEAGRQDPT